jgi:hypothetical protein
MGPESLAYRNRYPETSMEARGLVVTDKGGHDASNFVDTPGEPRLCSYLKPA